MTNQESGVIDKEPTLDKNARYTCEEFVAYIRAYADGHYPRHTMTWGALRALATHLERL